ncbi:hypothetical protein LC048_00045 [Mesobacillus subterraneus]|uniref:hypothetical protein n=1 Tax=Mesobacillus subterraneus TaxID=285983 RepID=UPI001CFF1DB3|nr:hypothetical protein [Mesobacillus subterraneus]WLR55456.1 hypothetical protein LC048_00045 [Mesobacillus subterraneus]
MKKLIWRLKYHWHSYLHGYNKALIKECICSNLRNKLAERLEYHEKMATKHHHQLQTFQTSFS